MQILIAVTHLLGTGHLRRALNLSQAFVDAGHRVCVASGGLPVATFDTTGLTLHQLPPLQSDGTQFTRLLDADGVVVNEETLAARKQQLLTLVTKLQPDIVITELFPFGRRVLHPEFTSLLRAANTLAQPAVVLSSVRDILAPPSSEKKVKRTEALIAEHYDGILVHSNLQTTPIDISWPVTELIQSKVHYTGYVAQSVDFTTQAKPQANPQANPQAKSSNKDHLPEVIVSAGGGSVGRHIYETAIQAAALVPDLQWRILVGGIDSATEVENLKSLDKESMAVIEPNRADFRSLLSAAACSVSMCGYNTAIDLLLTGTPGVLIPFDDGGEVEQTLRAKSLTSTQSYVSLPAKYLNAESLAKAVREAIGAGRFKTDHSQFNGALESVRIASKLLQHKRGNTQ